MKSCRLNSVAFKWLQGGHQAAPQYTNTGLFWARADANAASTSPSLEARCQAMPAVACAVDGADAEAAAEFAVAVAVAEAAAAADAAADALKATPFTAGSGLLQAMTVNAASTADVRMVKRMT